MADERVSIHVVGDADDARRAVRGTREDVRGLGRDARRTSDDVDHSGRRMERRFGRARVQSENLSNSLLRMKLIAGALTFGPAISGASALTSQIVALTGALGPAIGGLTAAPSVLSATLQGLGSVGLAAGGVGDAVKATLEAQKSAVEDSTAALDAQERSAERVRDAERRLGDTKDQARFAEQDLTAARRDARRELEDLRLEAERSVIAEEGAALARRRARQELNRTLADPTSSALDIAEAENRLASAGASLQEVRSRARRANRDLQRAESGGVEGMPQMVAASRALEAAQGQAAEAARDLAIAEREAGQSAGSASSAVTKQQQAMAELSPAARELVRTIVDLKPAWDDLQETAAENLFPGVQSALEDGRELLPLIDRLVSESARVIGDDIARAGRELTSAEWQRDLATFGDRNVETLDRMGDTTLHLANAMRHLMVEADPLLDWITASIEGWAESKAQQAEMARQTGDLARFFDDSRFALEHLFSILGTFGSALGNVFAAGRDEGQDMLVSLDRMAGRFDDWTESLEGQQALKDWFADGADVMESIGDGIGRIRDRIQDLEAEGEDSGDALIIALSEAFTRALSQAVESLGERAPALAEGFIKGFLAADAWGRLAIGTWLIAKMGGLRAFATMGGTTGATFGTSFGTAAGASAGSSFGPKFLGVLRGVGPGLAIAVAAIFGPEVVRAIDDKVAPETRRFGLPKTGDALSEALREAVDGSLDGFDPLKIFHTRGREDIARGLLEALDIKEFESAEDRLRSFGDTAIQELRKAARGRDLAKLDSLASEARDLAREFPDAAGALERFADTADKLRDLRDPLAPAQDALTAFVLNLADAPGKVRAHVRGMIDELDKLPPGARTAGLRAALDLAGQLEDKGALSGEAAKAIKRMILKPLREARKQGPHHARVLKEDTIEQVELLLAAVATGVGDTTSYLNAAMKALGLEPVEFTAKGLTFGGKKPSTLQPNRPGTGFTGPYERDARGGLHQFGQPGDVGRDSILTQIGKDRVAVAPGEVAAVFNRHQLPIVNERLADFGGLPGFFREVDTPHYMAEGGIVGRGLARGGFPMVSGDTDFVPALGRALSAMAKSAGQPIFVQDGRRSLAEQADLYGRYLAGTGNLAAAPSPDAPHVRGIAADITPGREAFGGLAGRFGLEFTVPSESWHIELANAAAAGDAAAIQQLQRVVLEGPDGPLTDIGQAVLDRVREGAQTFLDDQAGSLDFGTPGGSGPALSDMDTGGSGKALMQQIARERGWNFDHWWELDGRETSHGRNLFNPNSTASLRGQFLDMNWGRYGPGSDPRQDPSMVQQIRSFADYIDDRYGDPTAALAHHDEHGWYDSGGIVGGALADAIPAARGFTPSLGEVRGEQRTRDELRGKIREKPDSKKLQKRLAESERRLDRLRSRRKAGRRRERRRFDARDERLADFELPDGLIDAVTSLDRQIEDKDDLFDIHERTANSDDVLTQDELDQLIAEKLTVRNMVGGEQFGTGGMAALLEDQVLPTVLDKIDKLEGRLEKWRDRLKSNQEAIKRKRREARQLRRRARKLRQAINDATTKIRRIDRKENPTAADRRQRERLANNRERWSGELDDKRRKLSNITERQIPALERDNFDLVGDGSLASPDSGSVIGEAQEAMSSLVDHRDDYQDRLRPGGLLTEWTVHDLAAGALREQGATGEGDTARQRASLLEGLLAESRQDFRVSQAQFSTLSGFAGSLGRTPFVGSFAAGGRVPETGLAMVHKDEIYLGAPGSSGGPPPIHVSMSADLEAFWRAARGHMSAQILDEATDVVSRQQGQRIRALRAAPGRG